MPPEAEPLVVSSFPDFDSRDRPDGGSSGLNDDTETVIDQDIVTPEGEGRPADEVDFVAEAEVAIETDRGDLERADPSATRLTWTGERVLVTSASERVVDLDQTIGGIPVFGMTRSVVFDARSFVRNITGDHLPPPADLATEETLSVEEAARSAIRWVTEHRAGKTSGSGVDAETSVERVDDPDGAAAVQHLRVAGLPDDVVARKVVFPQPGRRGTLGWLLELSLPLSDGDEASTPDHGLVIVDAANPTAEVLYAQSADIAVAAVGDVFPLDHAPASNNRVRVAFDFRPAPTGLPAPYPALAEWCTGPSSAGAFFDVRSVAPSGLLNTLAVAAADPVVFAVNPWNGDDQRIVSAFQSVNVSRNFFECLGHAPPGKVVVSVGDLSTDADAVSHRMRLGKTAPFDFTVVAHEYSHLVFGDLVRLTNAQQLKALNEGYADFWALTLKEGLLGGGAVSPIMAAYSANGADVVKRDYTQPVGGYGSVPMVEPHKVGMTWCAALLAVFDGWTGPLGRAAARVLIWQVALDSLKLSRKSQMTFLGARAKFATALEAKAPPSLDVLRKAMVLAFATYGL